MKWYNWLLFPFVLMAWFVWAGYSIIVAKFKGEI